MGIFSYKFKTLSELKIDGEEVEEREHDDNSDIVVDDDITVEDTDDTDEPAEPSDDNKDTEGGTEDDYNIPDDDAPDDTGDESEGSDDEDITIDVDEESTDGEESSEDEPEEDTGSNDSNNELKNLENDLFKDLEPEQLSIKNIELKQQYVDLFDSVSDIVTRINKIIKTTENTDVIKFTITKLIELKDMVHFYLKNTYPTKTHIENIMMYQQYLAVLNTIDKLLQEISPKPDK